MSIDNLIDALRLAIAKSPAVIHEGPKALHAQASGSPIAERRAARVIAFALSDPRATFTEAERLALAGFLPGAPPDARIRDIRFRVTPDEKQLVQAAADAAGMTVSAYIRRRIGLD